MILKDDRLLIKIISFWFAKLYDFWLFIGDVFSIHLNKKHIKSKQEYEGALPQSDAPSRIAVVAIYPSDESVIFTKNLLGALVENKFYVLVVSTRTMNAKQRDVLIPCCNYLIERHNIGQDFGSYKHGLDWLEKNGNKLETADLLTLANDSMFYPQCFNETVRSMVNCKETWQCLFENFHLYHHAQSFFLLFRKEIFQQLKVFWAQYVPYTSRIHAIHQGEIGMTKALKKQGFFPHAYYRSVIVVDAINNIIKKQLVELKHGHINRENIVDFMNLVIESHGGLPNKKPSLYTLNLFIERALVSISRMMNHMNPTHAVGLIIARAMNAPIKRDCCYRASYDLVSVLNHVGGFNEEELAMMEKDLRKKGTGSGVSGWRRLLYARGRI